MAWVNDIIPLIQNCALAADFSIPAKATLTIDPGTNCDLRVCGKVNAQLRCSMDTFISDRSMSCKAGSARGQFAITNNCGNSLVGHAVCTITVTFTPTTKGAQSAFLNANGGGGLRSVALTGTYAAEEAAGGLAYSLSRRAAVCDRAALSAYLRRTRKRRGTSPPPPSRPPSERRRARSRSIGTGPGSPLPRWVAKPAQ